jgi:hypothetical protein
VIFIVVLILLSDDVIEVKPALRFVRDGRRAQRSSLTSLREGE